jgi:3-hydroxyisobutyrate dehydrogenase-like beta-hydroxyacid dehydrogenase
MRGLAKRCRRIILALPSEAALRAVSVDLAAACSPGTIVIETGTLPLAAKIEARDLLLAGRGVTLLDCTLSGTGAQPKRGIWRFTPAATKKRSGPSARLSTGSPGPAMIWASSATGHG